MPTLDKKDAFSDRPKISLRLVVDQTSQSVTGNTSVDSWKLYATETSSQPSWSAIAGDNDWEVKLTGTNAQTWSGSFTFDFRASGNQEILIASGSRTVDHAADGTRSTAWQASADSVVLGDAALSGSLTQTTIPRATTPTVPGPVDAGSNLVITTTRASSSFKHTLKYSFFGASGTIVSDSAADSYTWAVPLGLLAQIPDDTSGVGTITCDTYNGSTKIGSKTVSFTVKAGAGVVPTVSTLTLSEAVTAPVNIASVVGGYVQGQSKLNYAISGAEGPQGATITSYKLTVAGQTVQGQSGVTGVLGASGTVSVVATVTDSRGRTATKTNSITVIPWAPPMFTGFVVQRSTGSTVDPDGTDLKVTVTASVSSLVVGSQKNSLTYKTFTRLRGGGAFTLKGTTTAPGVTVSVSYVITGPYAQALAYDARVEVSDLFVTVAAATLVSVAKVALHVSAGLGVGKYWEHGALDVGGDVYVAGKVILSTDTDWVTTGLTITPATDWTLMSYRLKRAGGRVIGRVTVRYDGSTITAGADGNITDKTAVITLPNDWKNGAGMNFHVPVVQSGVKTWWGRANGGAPTLDVTHASFPGQTIVSTDQFDIQLDYPTA